MREFIVLGHDAPTTPSFSLDDLAGGAGRLDVLCRCLTAAFVRSHGIREDVRVWLSLRDELALRFEGERLRRLNPDERSTAALVRTALERRDEAVGRVEVETTPGVFLSKRDFAAVLDEIEGTLVELHADGDPVVDVDPPADPAFVLSDHRDFTDREAALLEDRGDASVRLGPVRLHADQAITVAHNYLDTDGYRRY